MIITEEVKQERDKILGLGMRLAESKDHLLLIDKKRGNKKYTMGNMLEGLPQGSIMRAHTAIMLENMRKYIANMDETTRMLNIGDFDKFAFPIVRVLFPNLALHELASVQPMTQSIGLVFFTKFIYGQSKGAVVAGTDAFDNPNAFYSSETIDQENVGTGDGVTTNYTPTLAYTPIKPGTVSFTTESAAVTLTVTDDGSGALAGDVGAPSTINYQTGAINVTFSGAPDLGVAVNATYDYNMEANTAVPQIDMQLTSSPVQARTRKLRTLWSMESAQDLLDMHGMNIETEQAGAMMAKLKAEIDREGIDDMQRLAALTVTAFSRTTPAGVSYTEHKLSFLDKLVEASNTIFSATQLATANWVDAGVTVCNLIESLPGFVSLPRPKNTRGIYKTGRINDLDVWKDPGYNVSGVATPTGFMVGLKGDNMFDTGYIHAPYIMAYTTGKIELDDFISRKGTASRYGKKPINGNFYCTSTVTGTAP